ncbi:MAG: 50S ribosomal protein L17 [Candidatus Margulisbacteria bacterium]|nr:50S ribosomal protein L17 [Candidatus Margulisiibacteriota bacterium]
MRHRKGNLRLSKATDQRMAMLKGLVRGLFLHEKIRTSYARAKEAQKLAEKIITIAKKNDLFARRKVESIMAEKKLVSYIFKVCPERFEGRAGGCTRVIKTGFRRGDAAQMAVLELV